MTTERDESGTDREVQAQVRLQRGRETESLAIRVLELQGRVDQQEMLLRWRGTLLWVMSLVLGCLIGRLFDRL
jgi:hypothetical protein